MISKKTNQAVLYIVILILLGFNFYYLVYYRLAERTSSIVTTTQINTHFYIEQLSDLLFEHIALSGEISLIIEDSIFTTPKLVCAYNDRGCTPCILNEFENIKQFSSQFGLKDIVIMPLVSDIDRFIKMLHTHKMDSYHLLFPRHDQLIVHPESDKGFIVYFVYHQGSSPRMIFFPKSNLPDLTIRYYKLIGNLL